MVAGLNPALADQVQDAVASQGLGVVLDLDSGSF